MKRSEVILFAIIFISLFVIIILNFSFAYAARNLCGNSVIDSGEQCDLSNLNGQSCTSLGFEGGSPLLCSSTCQFNTVYCYKCGDAKIGGNEQCDNGASNTNVPCIPEINYQCSYCNSSCVLKTLSSVCGNKVVEGREQCDDNNTIQGDKCYLCKNETCGNGFCGYMPPAKDFCNGGDINGDEQVGLSDYNIIKVNFGKTPATYAEGDANGDGQVGLSDYNIVKANFGATGCIGPGYVKENATNCPSDCGNVIYGTEGNDVFQIKYGHIYLNGVDKGVVVENIKLYGLGGNDIFTTISTSSQTIYGGEGLDSFWVDSIDEINDSSAEEINGIAGSPVSSIHNVVEYYQPTLDPLSKPSLDANGQSLVDPSLPTGTCNGIPCVFAYTSFSSPLFVDEPEYNDPIQGNIPDCYFIAALSSFALKDGFVIKQAIVDLGDGTYAVRFYRGGAPVYVRVDRELPVATNLAGWLWGAKRTPDGEGWAQYFEKAFAEFRNGQNSYDSIKNGWQNEVYSAISTKVSSIVSVSSYSLTNLGDYISSGLNNNYPYGSGSPEISVDPIASRHAYAIISTRPSGNSWNATVYNPWGQDGNPWDNNYSDGLLEISGSLFQQAFSAVCRTQT